MNANRYKDDAGEIVCILLLLIPFQITLTLLQEDPMKPMLDAMIKKIVNSLSGRARAFYDREFSFFNEVTSISGKLKPYIKKTKPEKKVNFFRCLSVLCT